MTDTAAPASPDETVAPPKSKRARFIVIGVLFVAALMLLVTNLGQATTYFKTADEAVRDKAELGDRRFRIQGLVVPGSLDSEGERSTFTIESNDVTVAVVHQGDPPELFKEGIGVVLEGRWAGAVYRSDRILVRHSSEYKAENPERIPDNQPE